MEIVPDTLLQISSAVNFTQPNTIIWAFLSLNADALTPDDSRLIPAPTSASTQAQVYTWVNDPSLCENHFLLRILVLLLYVTWNINPAPQKISQIATLQTINVTFYLWTFSCTLTANEVTAHVSGNNELLSYTPDNTPAENTSLLETTWESLISAILFAETPGFWLEDGLVGPPPTVLAALEDRLSSTTTLAYALASQSWSQNSTTSTQPGAGSLISMDVTQPQLMGQIHVNPIQAFFGIVAAVFLAISVLLMLWTRWSGNRALQRDLGTDMMRGGIIDFVVLLNNSSLPLLFAWKPENHLRPKPTEEEIQRKRAEVLFVG